MTDRYSWAISGRQARGGRAADRAGWAGGRGLPPEASVAPVPPGGGGGGGGAVGGGGGGGGGAAWPPPVGDDALWQPIGPTTTVRGLVDSDVRVSGRVNDIRVSDDGNRAYAVSALGGVWYSGDAGARWEPVGAWRTSDRTTLAPSSHTLSGGAVHVRFGAGIADDEVWVGTGEPAQPAARDSGVVGHYGGVGVLHRRGPVTAARADPLADPWDPVQAVARPAAGAEPAYSGLRGQGVYRFAEDPATPRSLLAATTAGLHRHNPVAAAGTDPWSLVTVNAWELLSAGASARVRVTDVAWLPATGGHPARVWACLVDATTPALTGLWFSNDGGATFAPVALPALPAGTSRLSLAAHRNHPDTLYVLGTGPNLWRIDGSVAPPAAAPAATAVNNLPAALFGTPPADQSDYDCAAAIDPANSGRVIIGGAAVASPIDAAGSSSPSWAAALYLLTVGPGVAPGTFTSDYVAGEAADRTWVGSEVHADVHALTWVTPGGAGHVWVGCDGGVFGSSAGAANGTFVSRNTGMSVSEPGFVANHPTSPGPVLAGMQDNGPQLRIGDGVWRQAIRSADAGGAAFDPGTPGRFVVQTIQAIWNDDDDRSVTPTFRNSSGTGSHYDLENRASRFYSNPAVVRTTGATPETRLAVGTDRVWLSTQWGRSWWDGTGTGTWRRRWVTLPTGTDPRSSDAATPVALSQDRLPAGPVPWGATTVVSGIRALRWLSPTVLMAVTRGAVHSLTDPGGPGPWALTPVATRLPVPGGGVPAVVPAPAAAAGLPGFGEYNDIAVHDAAAGSFYLATSHPLDPVWWFDGAGQCHPTGLGTLPAGTRAAAYSVVVDPTDSRILFVGTTVGVWQGRFTAAAGGNPASWEWRHFSNGLPEAAAQDLSIGSWPRPGGGAPLRLLRVALQSRGLFEVDLGAAAAAVTFVRVHPYDTRRILPTPMPDPMSVPARPRRVWTLDWALERNRDHRTGAGHPRAHPDGTPITELLWHASPDVVCRPAPVSAAPGAVPRPPDLPWSGLPADRFWLWSLQTAIRALDPVAFPDAPLIVPDGRWTAWWVQRLRRIRTALGLANVPQPNRVRVDSALWNEPRVQAGFWSAPWAAGGPTEADLIERVVGIATPRGGPVSGAARRAAGAGVLRRRYHVDVCVHHRGRSAAQPGDVAVTLLRATLPANPAAWSTTAAPVVDGLAAALDGLPADTSAGVAPGALPGWAPPAGWAFVDAARPARRPAAATASAQGSVLTFDADFSGLAAGADLLLLALVHRRGEPVSVPPGGVREAVIGSSHAAAHSIRAL